MLSIRIRLMNARVRFLLDRAEDWDAAAWAMPCAA
jgi:hypothetical protein